MPRVGRVASLRLPVTTVMQPGRQTPFDLKKWKSGLTVSDERLVDSDDPAKGERLSNTADLAVSIRPSLILVTDYTSGGCGLVDESVMRRCADAKPLASLRITLESLHHVITKHLRTIE